MSITPDTREAILAAAWQLIVEQRRVTVSMTEVATAAGVSRQTLHLAFGGRNGMLVAMARRADRTSPGAVRMGALLEDGEGDGAEALGRFLEAWFEHLPVIYPVAVLLEAARESDPAARAAWDDRMEGLRAGFTTLLKRARAGGRLKAEWSVSQATDLAWSLSHVDAWRHLVVERGWPAARFVATTIRTIENLLFKPRARRGRAPRP